MDKKRLRISIFVLLFLGLSFLFSAVQVPPALAQEATPSDDEVNAIARQLYCPVCENTPLDVCPTEACRQWRDLIRQMLAEGRTEDEIKQYFVDNYGARVLAEPPRSGFFWLVYIVPPAAILAAAFFFIRAFRTWKQMAREPAGGSAASDGEASQTRDDYAARLEAELEKRK
ncbi:MAG: cytochrome c-type biogenesis protein CcmH [Anaerolineales bacterium]|nr:cytochrome c-type biogenesis protein CcmH [Anaerolineales bacterium]